MKKNLRNISVTTLLIILTGLVLIAASSCIRVGLVGSGNVVSEERDVSGFDSVSISTGLKLFIEQTGEESLIIQAEDNILPKIDSSVRNGTLEIKIKPMTFGGINTKRPINCYLTVKDIEAIDISSGASVETDILKTENLIIDISSGSKGYLEIDVDELEVDLSSGSDMEISGKAVYQYVDLSSGSIYDAKDLESEETVLDASSGSNAEINVSEKLDVDISSGSNVKYLGSPEVITDISSGGSLESLSE